MSILNFHSEPNSCVISYPEASQRTQLPVCGSWFCVLQFILGWAGLFHASETSEPSDLLILFTQQALIIQEAEAKASFLLVDSGVLTTELSWTPEAEDLRFCYISEQSLRFKGCNRDSALFRCAVC